jgi:hypothetical protein
LSVVLVSMNYECSLLHFFFFFLFHWVYVHLRIGAW